LGEYIHAFKYAQSASKIYTYYPRSNEIELFALLKLNRYDEALVKFSFILDSLTFDNELKFCRQQKNNLLEWELVRSLNYALRKEEDGDDWCYSGILQSGYGNSPMNEIKINILLREEKIDHNFLDQGLTQYQKIEKKLLSLNDLKAFSSDQLVNFYYLSFDHANKLYRKNDLNAYKTHLEKEIKRMESFGINCSTCSDPTQRIPIPIAYNSQKDTEYQKIQQTISDCGLSNSLQVFYDQFPLIYGKFIFNYLIYLIREGDFFSASQLYKTMIKPLVKNRDSYFYNHYWDIILGLRKINGDLNSHQNLTAEEQIRKLNKKIEEQLKIENIPLTNFENIKSNKISAGSGSNAIEIDDAIISDKLIWSKNIGLVNDGVGNSFQLTTQTNVWEYNRDSIPGYCFYDYEEQNGLKYGKLYNYWAMKLLVKNPPLGWRFARQSDFSKYLHIDSLMEEENKGKNPYDERIYTFEEFLSILRLNKEDLPVLMDGQHHRNGFCCIDTEACFWTDESSIDDPRYQKVVDFYSSGEIRFSDYSNKDESLFSIRLVKSK